MKTNQWKALALSAVAMLCSTGMSAQGELLKAQVETRGDYQGVWVDGESNNEVGGFRGKYLNVRLDGKLNENFSYSYRQRLNKTSPDQSYFDATDWIYLTYSTGSWELSAGKQVVGIGGYEYDRAPINLYFCSEYWNNIACYQMGASVANNITPNDKLMFQVCQSPFGGRSNNSYAYNLMWYGQHGIWSTIWSANVMETPELDGDAPSSNKIYYLALGNRFDVGHFALELDFMNRATKSHAFWLKDCSVMAELQYHPNDKWNIFGKYTYDVNKSHDYADGCVYAGTEINSVGAGLEYYALTGKNQVRLHAYVSHAFGKNGNLDGTLVDNRNTAGVGLTWSFNFLNL